MKRDPFGTYIETTTLGETVRAFVPPLTTPTINSLLRELESRGIIKESTGRARDRVYVYRRYLEALAAEEEAPARAAAK